MRVVRTLLGILLITFSILSLLAGGMLATVLGHAGADGAYRTSMSGLDTAGYAIVVPDVGALLKKQAPFARWSGAWLRVTGSIGGAPAFVGLAPFSAVATYLGPMPYGRVDSIHVGLHGMPVTVNTVAGPKAAATVIPGGVVPIAANPSGPIPGGPIPGGAPDRQRFWLARSFGGMLAWSPRSGPAAAPGTALVIMRADGLAGVHVTATAELHPGALVGTTISLLGAGLALALVALALLLWPLRRREVVYVVEPAQVPEIAARLGVPAGPAFADASAGLSARGAGAAGDAGAAPPRTYRQAALRQAARRNAAEAPVTARRTGPRRAGARRVGARRVDARRADARRAEGHRSAAGDPAAARPADARRPETRWADAGWADAGWADAGWADAPTAVWPVEPGWAAARLAEVRAAARRADAGWADASPADGPPADVAPAEGLDAPLTWLDTSTFRRTEPPAYAVSDTDPYPIVETPIPDPRGPEASAPHEPEASAPHEPEDPAAHATGPAAPVTARGVAPAPPGATLDREELLAIFADPKTRPTSLTAVLLLPPLAPAGSRGTYRSAGGPPSVTPTFLWAAPEGAEDEA